MTITTAPALLIGIGARVVLDHFSRTDGPYVKDYILVGAWQGVALHYAAKTSKTSGFGIIVAFLIAAKLFIEFSLASDFTKCVTTILGVALGVLFTDFLSQYFDKPRQSSERRRRQSHATKPVKLKGKVVQFRPSVQGGSVETSVDITDIGTSLATSSHLISDITSVDSSSDKFGPAMPMSPLEREIHVLRTRASLADSERRRFKEERKWAISQGNMARAQQMKWEVKRYTSLMQTFTHEADIKAQERTFESMSFLERAHYFYLIVANLNGGGNGHYQSEPEEQKPAALRSRDRPTKSSRDSSQKANAAVPNTRLAQKSKRSPNSKTTARDGNG